MMDHPVLVSVVIPLYNKENFIGETLRSVLNQTFESLEIIVVNDGSTDSSLAVVKEFSDDRIVILEQQNRGVEAARNNGFELSQGELVIFLDGDDQMLPERIERQVTFMLEHPSCALSGTWAQVVRHGTPTRRVIAPPCGPTALKLALAFENPFVCSSVMVRRLALQVSGAFKESQGSRFVEDYELWSRIAEFGEVRNLGEILTTYVEVEVSRSRTNAVSLAHMACEISALNIHKLTNGEADYRVAYDLSLLGFGDGSALPKNRLRLSEIVRIHSLIRKQLETMDAEDSDEFLAVFRRQRLQLIQGWTIQNFPPWVLKHLFSIIRAIKRRVIMRRLHDLVSQLTKRHTW